MIKHLELKDKTLHQMIKRNEVVYGGNLKLKIYGTLNCKSGKRMKKKNRVFFKSLQEAIIFGFRPCGHCLRADYKTWKNESI